MPVFFLNQVLLQLVYNPDVRLGYGLIVGLVIQGFSLQGVQSLKGGLHLRGLRVVLVYHLVVLNDLLL